MHSSYRFFIFLYLFNFILNEQKKSQIKAAIFDLDGTLLDSQKLYDEVNQIIINKYGNGKEYNTESKMFNYGAPPLIGNKYLIETFNIKLTIDELIKKKDEFLKENVNLCLPMEGAREITHILKHEYGFKMGLATSSVRSSVDIKLSNLKEWVDSDFDAIITGDDKRVFKGKPNPDIFLLTAKELGVDIEECIIFEDAVNGVQAGLNSGAQIVIATPNNLFREKVQELTYNKEKTKLFILDSLKDFDYSLIK